MANLEDLKIKLNRYYYLKEVLGNVVSYLEQAIEKIGPAASNLFYEIDGLRADKNIVLNEKTEIINKNNRIKQYILPEIEEEIYETRKQIREQESLLNNTEV